MSGNGNHHQATCEVDTSRSASWKIGIHPFGAGRTGSAYSRVKREQFIKLYTDKVLFSSLSLSSLYSSSGAKGGTEKTNLEALARKTCSIPGDQCKVASLKPLPVSSEMRWEETKVSNPALPSSPRRLIPLYVKTYEEVLDHWHKGVPGSFPPLKSMKIIKKVYPRDYNLWYRRRAIALVYDRVGKDKFHAEFVTTKDGKKRTFGSLTTYCLQNLRKVLNEKPS